MLLIKAHATKGGTGEGRWVTINGSPVFIQGGTVTKGPKALMGVSFTKGVDSTFSGRRETSLHHSNGESYKVSTEEFKKNEDILTSPKARLKKAISYSNQSKVDFAKSLVGTPKENIPDLTMKAARDKKHPLYRSRGTRDLPGEITKLVNLFEQVAKLE